MRGAQRPTDTKEARLTRPVNPSGLFFVRKGENFVGSFLARNATAAEQTISGIAQRFETNSDKASGCVFTTLYPGLAWQAADARRQRGFSIFDLDETAAHRAFDGCELAQNERQRILVDVAHELA